MKVRSQRIIFSYLLFELILLNLSFMMVAQFKYGFDNLHKPYYHLPLLVIFNVCWFLVVIINGSQDYYMAQGLKRRLVNQIRLILMFIGTISPLILLLSPDFSRTMIFGTPITFFILNLIGFMLANKWVSLQRNQFTFGGSRLLVVGADSVGKQVLKFTQRNKHLGYSIVGFLDDRPASAANNGVHILGKVEDLPKVLDSKNVDEIVITLPSYKEEDIRYAIETADYRGIRVNLIPDYLPEKENYSAYNLEGLPVIELHQTPLDQFHNFIFKKAFDIVFATCVLILLSPILIGIAVAIYLDDKGPVFYKPVRKGQGGHDFTCYKFRTMYVNYDDSLKNVSTQKDDPRITRVGRILRKYSLDELPQFLNVLEGRMSVVGPRPHRVSLNDDLQSEIKSYMIRHYVKPGITGWAQVNGWRGPTETEEQKQGRISHDLWYIRNWGFWLDIKIIWMTVFNRKTWETAF